MKPEPSRDIIAKAFGHDSQSQAALDEITIKLVRINPDLCWWIDRMGTVDILNVMLRDGDPRGPAAL